MFHSDLLSHGMYIPKWFVSAALCSVWTGAPCMSGWAGSTSVVDVMHRYVEPRHLYALPQVSAVLVRIVLEFSTESVFCLVRCALRSIQPRQCLIWWSSGKGHLHSMLAQSVKHHYVSDLLLDFCAMVVKRGRKIVQSDLTGVLDLILFGCCFSCTLPAEGGCFGTGNMPQIPTQIRTNGCSRGGGGGCCGGPT